MTHYPCVFVCRSTVTAPVLLWKNTACMLTSPSHSHGRAHCLQIDIVESVNDMYWMGQGEGRRCMLCRWMGVFRRLVRCTCFSASIICACLLNPIPSAGAHFGGESGINPISSNFGYTPHPQTNEFVTVGLEWTQGELQCELAMMVQGSG